MNSRLSVRRHKKHGFPMGWGEKVRKSRDRLNGTSRPMLTATCIMYIPMGVWNFQTFFDVGSGDQTPTDLHAKWLKRRVVTQGCAVCSKNRYFSHLLGVHPLKVQKLENFGLGKFVCSVLLLTFRSPERSPVQFLQKIERRVSNDDTPWRHVTV